MDHGRALVEDRSRIAWWLVTLVLGALLLYVVYSFLGAFVLGVFIYYATRPIYEQFEGLIRPRSLGVALALSTIALPVLVLVGYTVAIGISELNAVVGTDLSTYRGLLQPYLDLLGVDTPQELVSSVLANPQQLQQFGSVETLQRFIEPLGSYLQTLVSGLLQMFIALAVAFYLLRDDYRLAGWIRTALSRDDGTLIAYGQAVDRDLKTIYFGNILNAFVVAVVAAISYNALNLVAPPGLAIPVPTLLGLLTGAASLIPVVGMKVVYAPVTVFLGAVALGTNAGLLWYPLAFLLVSAVVVDGATELILRPYISGRNLHVGMVLFAYIFGPLLFGWYGLFFGPLLLVLIVHLARIVLPELIHGEPVRPDAIGADPIPDADGPVRSSNDGGPEDEDAATEGNERESEDEQPDDQDENDIQTTDEVENDAKSPHSTAADTEASSSDTT